jgi:hypothetical protein
MDLNNTNLTGKIIGRMKTILDHAWDPASLVATKGGISHNFRKLGTDLARFLYANMQNENSYYMFYLGHTNLFASLSYMNLRLKDVSLLSMERDAAYRAEYQNLKDIVTDNTYRIAALERRSKRRRGNDGDDADDDDDDDGMDYKHDEEPRGRPVRDEMDYEHDDDPEVEVPESVFPLLDRLPIVAIPRRPPADIPELVYESEEDVWRMSPAAIPDFVSEPEDEPPRPMIPVTVPIPMRTVTVPRLGGGTVVVPTYLVLFPPPPGKPAKWRRLFKNEADREEFDIHVMTTLQEGAWREVDVRKMKYEDFKKMEITQELWKQFRNLPR